MAIKLFFLDMEGTLFAQNRSDHVGDGVVDNSFWGKIVVHLGEEAIQADRDRWRQWKSGKYRNHMEWAGSAIASYQAMGLTKDAFESLLDSSPYSPGVQETVAALHQQGIITAIISGGFFALAGKAQKELGIHHALCAAHIHWNDSGLIQGWNLLPADNQGKVHFVELLRQEYGLSTEECAFVGDGKNDVAVASHVGTSFAYCAEPELRAVATHSIQDFREILPHLAAINGHHSARRH